MIWWHDSLTAIKPTCKKRWRVERPRNDSWTPCAYPYPKSLRLQTITQFWREHRSLEGRGFHFQFSFRVTVERVASWFWCWMFRRNYAAGILIIQQLVWYSNSLQSLEFQCKFRAIVLQNTECEPFKTKGLLDLFDLFVLFYAMARSAPPSQQVYEGQWKLDKAHGEGECAMVVPLRFFEEKIIRAGDYTFTLM